MNHSNRRNFLQKSTFAALAGVAATNGVAFGETTAETSLNLVDQDLAKVLRSYGRAKEMKDGGFKKEQVGAKIKSLPVSRLGVEVRNRASFRQSFEKLVSLSDRVLVKGNQVSFSRAGRHFVIENHVA